MVVSNSFCAKTIPRLLYVLAIAMAAVLSACGGGSGGGSTATASTGIGGSVIKGPVSGATITIYALNADGSRGSVLATTTTDASGNWSANVSAFPIEAVATGGSYTDESTGLAASLIGNGICAVIPNGRTQTAITPLTTSLASRVRNLILGGTTLAQAITQAENETTTALGFNPASIIPPDPGNVPAAATATEKEYAALLLGLNELANNNANLAAARNSVGVLATMQKLSDDIADGAMNGVDLDGQGIDVAANVPLPVLESGGLGVVNTAAQTLATSRGAPNLGGITLTSTPATPPVSKWDQFNWGQPWN